MTTSPQNVKVGPVRLTVRETQVAELARAGLAEWEIGRRLDAAAHRVRRVLARLAALGIDAPATRAALEAERSGTEPDPDLAERRAIAARIEAAQAEKRRRGEPGTGGPYVPRVYRARAPRRGR